MATYRHDVTPPLRLSLAVRERVERDGARAVVREIGVSSTTLAQIAGRLCAERAGQLQGRDAHDEMHSLGPASPRPSEA
jgi:hypothetical protein